MNAALLDLPDGDLRQRIRSRVFARTGDIMTEPGGDPEALSIFADPIECGIPDTAALVWLVERGIAPADIYSPFAVHAGRVAFQPGGRYEPMATGIFAYIIAAVDTAGIADAVAWTPTTNEIGTRLGRAFALGQAWAEADTSGTTGPAIRVHRDPTGWLRHGRRGIVIAAPELAAHALAGRTLLAEDRQHRRDLDRLLRLPRPTILSGGLAA